ncbi:amino acid ABC transporter substrate-binding protein [Clostridium sp. BJN0001]|uniref:amino acid ABC transporter substrate-binding protein n=1 Tax=Clostridium sp. BJN0001 TaxID=2930219 RepID=UPI001FD3DC0C|nr:amino acid ABC transporter substrate-binding protein [Clostridium sp. BJN0001]
MKRKRLLKQVLALLTTTVMAFAVVGCQIGNDTSSSSDDKKSDQLIVGLDNTFVPMGFVDDNGDLTGFDVELATEVCKKIGKDVKFQPIDWSMKESELNGDNIDLIWNGYSVTDDRKEKVEFSNVYLKNSQIIITLANSPLNSKADLKGKKVGAQNQSSSVDAVTENGDGIEKTFDGGKLVTYETNNDALMDLEAGRVDAIVADEILARYYMKERGEDKYKILSDNFGDEDYAIGIKKGNTELVNEINKGLKECTEDGTAAEISKKWFGKDIVVK